MSPASTLVGVVSAIALAANAYAAASPCSAASGDRRAVLVELYTSEGCDSCPPADAWLSRLRERGELGGTIVPLAFHVDYWDRLGWKDPYASPVHTQRQNGMASWAGSRFVYTPQFLRNGTDWRDRNSLLAVESGLPLAHIRVAPEIAGNTLIVTGEVVVSAGADYDSFVAVYENNLFSEVRSGENAGRRLRHDYVVRRLIGPLSLPAAGRLALREQVTLGADWKPADLGVVVFVQQRNRAQVVQSLQRQVCSPSVSTTARSGL